MHVKQYDITTVYLRRKLDEKVFMEVPEGMINVLRYMERKINEGEPVGSKARVMLKKLESGDWVCHMKKTV